MNNKSSDSVKAKTYKNNYLSQVIYKVNFPNSDEVNETSLKELKSRLGEGYSTLSNVIQQGLVIQGDPTGITTEQNNNVVWRIDSADQSHIIEIEKHSLAVITERYTHFNNFNSTIENVQGLFFETHSSITDIQRLGLRYINQIYIKESAVKWADYISENLVGPLGFAEGLKLRRSMHNMVLAHDEDTQINLSFGIFNKYFPAPIVDNEFIIDIDAFTTVAIKKDEITQTLLKFNEVITDYFEKSITDKLRIKMGVSND